MKTIDWNTMSELGLIERINREICHPLGLAVSRDVDTGVSNKILVSDDGEWEYEQGKVTKVLSDDKVRERIQNILEGFENA